MHFRCAIIGYFLANWDAPSRCTATDCLVLELRSIIAEYLLRWAILCKTFHSTLIVASVIMELSLLFIAM